MSNATTSGDLESTGYMRDTDDMTVAMAYVPWQYLNKTYDPEKALMVGTIFPELDKPFTGRSGGRR